MNRPGHVVLNTKVWSTDAEWQPTPEQPAIELFKLDSNGKQILPERQPEIVRPQFDLRQSLMTSRRTSLRWEVLYHISKMNGGNSCFDNPEGLLCQTKEPTPTKAPCECVIEINQVTLALISKCSSS